jgi:hypothetical protein
LIRKEFQSGGIELLVEGCAVEAALVGADVGSDLRQGWGTEKEGEVPGIGSFSGRRPTPPLQLHHKFREAPDCDPAAQHDVFEP